MYRCPTCPGAEFCKGYDLLHLLTAGYGHKADLAITLTDLRFWERTLSSYKFIPIVRPTVAGTAA
jgi:hypothetical protein